MSKKQLVKAVNDIVDEIFDTSELISLMSKNEIKQASRTHEMRANLEASEITSMAREYRFPFHAYDFLPEWQKRALRRRLSAVKSQRKLTLFSSINETNNYNSAA